MLRLKRKKEEKQTHREDAKYAKGKKDGLVLKTRSENDK
jgi:hypothetical protein